MIKHIVLFHLGSFSSEEEQTAHYIKLKEALEELPTFIPELHRLTISFNVNKAEPQTFVLEAFVKDLDALATYSSHPLHKEIVNLLIKPYLKNRSAIDIEVL